MKLSADTRRVYWNSETVFYSYRWLAWVLAGVSLTLPGRAATSLPRDAGILLLLGMINVAATATAQRYVCLVRRRPLLMLLDIVAGLVIVWMSGGDPLPFLPYALGGLVLPALLGGWGGAIIASTGFVGFDLLGLLLNSSGEAMNLPLLVLRAVVPAAFASCWIAVRHLVIGRGRPGDLANIQQAVTNSTSVPEGAVSDAVVQLNAFADVDHVSMGTQQRATIRLEPTPRSDTPRHAVFDPAPVESLSFASMIDQLAITFGRQGSVEMRVATVGVARPLTTSHHRVLLRVAQEALLNVSQHARAHSVLITLTFEPRSVSLSVQDDGVGLLDGTYERPGMHALRALRYRLSELEGQLAVVEHEGGGVSVRATLPME